MVKYDDYQSWILDKVNTSHQHNFLVFHDNRFVYQLDRKLDKVNTSHQHNFLVFHDNRFVYQFDRKYVEHASIYPGYPVFFSSISISEVS